VPTTPLLKYADWEAAKVSTTLAVTLEVCPFWF
jgi:hypothetical protein